MDTQLASVHIPIFVSNLRFFALAVAKDVATDTAAYASLNRHSTGEFGKLHT